MRTHGSGEDYQHPNVIVGNVEAMFSYGWYSQFKTVVTSEYLSLRNVTMPNALSFEGNPQRDYYDRNFPDALGKFHPFTLNMPYELFINSMGVFKRISQWYKEKIESFHDENSGTEFVLMLSGVKDIGTITGGFWRKKFPKITNFLWGTQGSEPRSVTYQQLEKFRGDGVVESKIIYGATFSACRLSEEIGDATSAVVHGTLKEGVSEALLEHAKELKKHNLKMDGIKTIAIESQGYYQIKSLRGDDICAPLSDLIQDG
jgi:hypothetical protein